MSKLSVHLSYLLRHNPDAAQLHMDCHGWVDADELIRNVARQKKYQIDRQILEKIVATDDKGRYRFSPDGKRIKACQGHSLEWVTPELSYGPPPEVLYHGTTAQAYEKIRSSGAIEKMKRHAVHLQPTREKAWQSACRWGLTPVILAIDARAMAEAGHTFGVSDNGVWCTEQVPTEFITELIWHI